MPRTKTHARHVNLALELEDARRLEAIRDRDGIGLTAQIRKGVALWLAQKDAEHAILDAAHHRKEKKTA
jgi:hypothetical protein